MSRECHGLWVCLSSATFLDESLIRALARRETGHSEAKVAWAVDQLYGDWWYVPLPAECSLVDSLRPLARRLAGSLTGRDPVCSDWSF